MLAVYIETSVVSYLKQRPAAHVVAAARQHLTRRWWDDERSKYQLVTSQYVIDEAALGDPLTWNCTHIANARIMPRVHAVLAELGHAIPLICTPEEMVDDDI